MEVLQSIFNNREIAIVLWGILVLMILLPTKAGKNFIKTAIPILLCKKFVVFYVVFISFLCMVLYGLFRIGVWAPELIKDTVFWVIFVEFPIFVKTIEKAKDEKFFKKLIKDNIAVSVAIEFLIDFWSFQLWIEILLIPVLFFVSALYAISEREKKYKSVKHMLQSLLGILGIILMVYALHNLICLPEQFFEINTLKSFALPAILLILNLPVIYGLAVYNVYEQIFIRLKGTVLEKRKMKVRLISFGGINLYKLTKVRTNLHKTILISLTETDLQKNLEKLQRELDLQIGDNYMKRTNFYVRVCSATVFISIVGLIVTNTEVSLKDLLARNFVIDTIRIREIFTYIFSTALVVAITLLILSIGNKKKKYEEISKIKKYALYELLRDVKKQEEMLVEYPPIDEPLILLHSYIYNAYEIKMSCDKVSLAYENLLTSWERETVDMLQSSATVFLGNFGINEEMNFSYDAKKFQEIYERNVKDAPQNEKINTFQYSVIRDLEKYVDKVKSFCRDFKGYYD